MCVSMNDEGCKLKIRHQNKIKFTQIHRNAYIHCSSLCHTYIYVTHSLQPFTFYVFALHRQFGAHQPNDRHAHLVFSKHIIIELHLNHVIRPHWHIFILCQLRPVEKIKIVFLQNSVSFVDVTILPFAF